MGDQAFKICLQCQGVEPDIYALKCRNCGLPFPAQGRRPYVQPPPVVANSSGARLPGWAVGLLIGLPVAAFSLCLLGAMLPSPKIPATVETYQRSESQGAPSLSLLLESGPWLFGTEQNPNIVNFYDDGTEVITSDSGGRNASTMVLKWRVVSDGAIETSVGGVDGYDHWATVPVGRNSAGNLTVNGVTFVRG